MTQEKIAVYFDHETSISENCSAGDRVGRTFGQGAGRSRWRPWRPLRPPPRRPQSLRTSFQRASPRLRGHYYGSIGFGFLSYPFYRNWAPSSYYGYGYGPAYYGRAYYGRGYYAPGYYGRAAYPAAAGGLAVDVQQALAELGYYTGPIDGIIGRGSRSALRAYQADYGLPVTGRIDRPTLDALDIG